MTKLCWVDVETTGLDPDQDSLLELGAAVTESSGTDVVLLDVFHTVLSFDVETHDGEPSPVVVKMHTENGLWDECRLSRLLVSDCDTLFNAFLTRNFPGTELVPLAGRNVGTFDRRFLERLKASAKRFHYRHMDMTGLRLTYGDGQTPECGPFTRTHRALLDALSDIDQYRWYKQTFRRQ
jgi:oligoribonuclease